MLHSKNTREEKVICVSKNLTLLFDREGKILVLGPTNPDHDKLKYIESEVP